MAFIHRLFGRKKKKLSFLSLFGRFDRHLSHHHRVVSIFPLLTRARTQSRRFRKKKRARTRFRHMENEFSRAKLHSRTPRSVRVSLFYSQKQNQTHANSASSDEKSLRELTFCLSVKEKKMKTRNQNRRSKSTLKNQRATRKSAQKTYLSACSASFALNTRSSRSILTLCDAFVCIFR